MSDSPVVGEYDYRNCQSLFGYAAAVHERSGGICQLCGAGSSGIDFDLWRQLTVEHLIGEAQGGYLRQISAGLARRFPGLGATALAGLAGRIDAANTVTACSFRNSMTSRNQAPVAMTDLIQHAPDGSPADIYEHVVAGLNAVLAAKKREVGWKLAVVRRRSTRLSRRALQAHGRRRSSCHRVRRWCRATLPGWSSGSSPRSRRSLPSSSTRPAMPTSHWPGRCGVLDPNAVLGGSRCGCRLLPGVGNAGSAAGSAQRARVPGAGPRLSA